VESGGRRPFDVHRFVARQEARFRCPLERVRPRVVESENVIEAILEEAGSHDLVVLGSTREPLLRRFTGLPVPKAVARELEKPIVMVNEPGGIRSWVRRWV
jgi:nucleotide-binding universal stress UspA family protein